MQRELRFRVWSNEKCFKKIENTIHELDGCYITTNRISVHPCGTLYDSHREDVIIEQYTGISDINGVPIYENDIIEAYLTPENYPSDNLIRGPVKFINFGWCLYRRTLSDLVDIKVIGNIHE